MITRQLGKMVGAVALCAGAMLLGACSSSSDQQVSGEEAPAAEQTEALAQVPAAEAGAKLGVLEWQFGTSLVRAVDAKGALLAEFLLHGESGTIESTLPDSGVRSVLDPKDSTLSARSAGYLDALRADLDAQLDQSPSALPMDSGAEVVDKATYYVYACYRLLADCRVTSTYGVLYGWWSYSECVYPVWQCSNPNYRFALRYIP